MKNKKKCRFAVVFLVVALCTNALTYPVYAGSLNDLVQSIDNAEVIRHYEEKKTNVSLPELKQQKDEDGINAAYTSGVTVDFVTNNLANLQPGLLFLSDQIKGQRPFALYFTSSYINNYGKHPAADTQEYAYANNVQQTYELKGNSSSYYMQVYLQQILSGNYPGSLIGVSGSKIDEVQPVYSFRTPSGMYGTSVNGTLYMPVSYSGDNIYADSRSVTQSFSGALLDGFNTNTMGFSNTVRYNKNHGNFIKTTSQGAYVGLSGVTPTTIACNANINGGYRTCTYRVSSISSMGDVAAGAFFPDDVNGRSAPSSYYKTSGTPVKIVDCAPVSSNCSRGGLTRAAAAKKYIETNPTGIDDIYHHGCAISDSFWQGMAQDYQTEWKAEKISGWSVTYHMVTDLNGNTVDAQTSALQTTRRDIDKANNIVKDYSDGQLLATYISNGYPLSEYPYLTNGGDQNFIYGGQGAYVPCDGEQLKGYILTFMKELRKDPAMLSEAGVSSSDSTWQAYKTFIGYWSQYMNVSSNSVITTSSGNFVKSNGYYATFSDPVFTANNDMAITRMAVYLGDGAGNKQGDVILELKRNFSNVSASNSYTSVPEKARVSLLSTLGYGDEVSNISTMHLKTPIQANIPTAAGTAPRSIFIDEIDYKDTSKYTVNLKPYIEAVQQEIINDVVAGYEAPSTPEPPVLQGGDANISSVLFPIDICLNGEEESLTEENAGTDRTLEELIDDALLDAELELVFEIEHSYLSALNMDTVLTESCVEKASVSKGDGSTQITCNDSSRNKVTSVVVGLSDITDYASMNAVGENVQSRGFFTYNKYATSMDGTSIKNNVETFSSRSLSPGGKANETYTVKLTGEEINQLMEKKAFSVRSHINRGHTIVGDDTNLTNNFAYMIFATDAVNRPESVPCVAGSGNCTGGTEDGIYLIDAETGIPVTTTSGGDMVSEVIPGREYRLVVEGTYVGGSMLNEQAGLYSSCPAIGSCGCCGEECSECQVQYEAQGRFTANKYKDYYMSWSGQIIGAKYVNTPSITDIISNMKFDTSAVLMEELASVEMASIMDSSMSSNASASGSQIKFEANADTDAPIQHKYVSRQFIAEAQRIEISIQEGELWTEAAVPNYSGGGCGSFCSTWINDDVLEDHEIGFGNGTHKSVEKLVFSDSNNNWNLKIANFEPLPRAEFATQDKEINIAVKYDLIYEVPDYAADKYEADIYVAFKAESINEERYKIEKIHIVPGVNKNITQYMSFPVSADMVNSTIDVSVAANIPAVTIVNPGGFDANGDYIPPTYAPSSDNTRAHEYNYCEYECPIVNRNKVLQDNHKSGYIYIVPTPEFCSVQGITCGNDDHWNQRNDWTTPYILRSFSKMDLSFTNLAGENRKLVNYYLASSMQQQSESHYETLEITDVKFRSKMTNDLKYGTDGWVDILGAFNSEAVLKAGYGFELEISVRYETNALNKNETYINVDGSKSVNHINIAPNLWEDIQLMLPDGSKVSMQGHMEGNRDYMELKEEPTIAITGGILKAEWTYSIKDLGSPDDMKEYSKFQISEDTRNGRYKIIISTPVMMGVGNKQSYWWYDGGDTLGLGVYKTNRLSPPSLAVNLLCDKVVVEFSVMGSIMDDPNTHTGN